MGYIVILLISILASNDIKQGLARKINQDSLFYDLFQLRIDNALLKIDQNVAHLKGLEANLNHSVASGKRDQEACIRKGLSQLRTINYVYPWLVDQLENIKGERLRYYMFEVLNRATFLSKSYIDISINIDQCILNIIEDQKTDRELVKDIADAKINVLTKDLKIKEYKASKRPFR